MALEPESQLALFPEPKECATCSVALQYGDLRNRYGQAALFRELTEPQAAALTRVEEAARLAGSLPNHCHEPHLLGGAEFVALRNHARSALAALGWAAGAPDPAFLAGREENARLRKAESERLREQRLAARATGPALDEFSDIPEFDPRRLTVERFRERLDRVPWFSRLGQPHPRDGFVDRIADWDEWGGPESRGGSPMGPESGRWEDALMAKPEPGPGAIRSLWSSVDKQALGAMPFGPEVDPWHGPTSASLQGAWVSSTIACYLLAGLPIPWNALRQWAWFARGHWPCGYSEDDDLPLDDNGDFLQEALDKARLVVF
jgi:hypothetical protein